MKARLAQKLFTVFGNGAIERVCALVEMAQEGNLAAIKMIWQYLDGLPRQTTDITSGDKPLPVPIYGGASILTD